jgi:hypothetical protein
MQIDHNKQIKELKGKFIEERERLVNSNRERTGVLKQELLRLKSQDEMNVSEIEQLRQSSSQQSQQLARAQTDLVEGRISLTRTQAEVEELKQDVYKTRRAATKRIRYLEHQINTLKNSSEENSPEG